MYRIHKFSDDESVDLRDVNEEALQLYARAKEACAARWTHFSFILRFDRVSILSGTSSELREYKIRAPWAWELDSIELYAQDSTNTGMTFTLATTGVTGVQDATVSIDATDILESYTVSARKNVDASTEVTFTLSNSHASNAADSVYAVVHGRTNPWSTLEIPRPPQVRDGETISATEWNTWFSNMSSTMTSAKSLASTRRVIEVYELHLSSDISLLFPPRGTASGGSDLDAADLYLAGSSSPDVDLSVRTTYNGATTTMASVSAATAGASSLDRNGLTVSQSTSRADDLDDATTYNSIVPAYNSGTLTRAYVVLFWGK